METPFSEYIELLKFQLRNDTCMFDYDFVFNFFSKPISVGKRLQVKKFLYHFENYKRILRNRCSFAIRFKGEIQ